MPQNFCEDFEMASVTLPDGSKREYEGPVTVAQVAASIGAGLAKAALAGVWTASWWISRT